MREFILSALALYAFALFILCRLLGMNKSMPRTPEPPQPKRKLMLRWRDPEGYVTRVYDNGDGTQSLETTEPPRGVLCPTSKR